MLKNQLFTVKFATAFVAIFVAAFAIALCLLTVPLSANSTSTNSSNSTSERSPNDAALTDTSTAGQLGAEFQISMPASPDADRYKPVIAYNSQHNEYLVVWHNRWSGNRDIYAQRITARGALVGPWFAISAGTNDRFQPAVAYNHTNDEYLIVWMYDVNGNGTEYEIWGKIIPWNGPGTMAEHKIFGWANRQCWTPHIAWNSFRNEYFVLWNALDTTTGLAHDVAGIHVAATTATPDAVAHIVSDNHNPHQADIVYNLAADGYLVVWRYMYSASDGDIYGRFLDYDGTPKGAQFAINVKNVDQKFPAVTTNSQDRYLVVWQHNTNSTYWDILGIYLDFAGSPAVGPFPIAMSTFPAMTPDVSAGDVKNEYVTVWEQTTSTGTAIRARRDRLTGSITTPVDQFEVATGGFWDNNAPTVTGEGAGYVFVYESDASGDPTVYRHIFGRAWWPNMLCLPLIRP